MRNGYGAVAALSIAGTLGACALAADKQPPVTRDGVTYFSGSRMGGDYQCDGLPIVIAGNRNALRLMGDCPALTVGGRRNDIEVWLRSGGRIEITGERNDVYYHQAKGREPELKDSGKANAFHLSSS